MNIYQPVISGSLTVTGSTTFFGNITVNSGSLTVTSGSLSGTASYALTSSFADSFNVAGNLTASAALVTGTLTAQTLVVQTITSSIVYSSGSNRFGNLLTDRQTFTGSVNITGSMSVTGSAAFSSDVILPYSKALAFNSISNQYITADSSNLYLGAGNLARLTINASTGAATFSSGGGTTGYFSALSNSNGTPNAAAANLVLYKDSTSGRSLNSAGTNNASGADYAEYMLKAIDDVIAKGDIVGINIDGLLTNIFADAISFVVKSSDPSFVGNDTWGAELEGDELEAARAKVDRIAFSGQVPCNVLGANVGDYIIPIDDNGKIKGQAITNPSFEQYQLSVGKVWNIMEDGRAWIAVKIG